MTTRRLAIVEQRGGRWVPTGLVKGELADTLMEALASGGDWNEATMERCVDERCPYAGSTHFHDADGTWIERDPA